MKAIVLLSLLISAVAVPSVHASERPDSPGEVSIAIVSPSAQSEVVRRYGWAEQEFAKVNKRVRWVDAGGRADATWRADGLLELDSALAAQRPDAAARFAKVAERASQWVARHSDSKPADSKLAAAESPAVAVGR